MSSHSITLRTSLLIVTLTHGVRLAAAESDLHTKTYLENHCIRCHGVEEQSADRRFDLLDSTLSNQQTAEQWQEILDVVNLSGMPPEDEPQPSAADTKRFVATVTQRLDAARNSLVPAGQFRFRRLNRYEYRNTIRDLLGVNIESFDPTNSFPADDRLDGFENIGEQLVLSDYLLQCYLVAASQSIEKAIQGTATVQPIHEVLTAKDMCRDKYHFRPKVWLEVNPTGKYVDVGHSQRSLKRVHAFRFKGVPSDGYYSIRIKAAGINREHPYSSKDVDTDRSEPIKMQVIVTDPQVARPSEGQNASDRIVATVPLADHKSKVYVFRTWMDKGFVPVLRYANGPSYFKRTFVRVAQAHHADSLTSNWRDALSTKPSEIPDVWLSDAYAGPRMRIHQMEIIGPESHSDEVTGPVMDGTPTALQPFLFQAFRRPPLASEVARYRAFFESRLTLGESEQSAFLNTCKAILCSANFLYVETPPGVAEPYHQSFRLASRLSYFLWSSMPDEQLFGLAASGQLSEPDILVAQTRRMLKDSRAAAFTEHFTDSWLHLNELGSMPPDSQKFSTYHDRQLEPLMRRETQLFFAEILNKNLSIDSFIDSDFTFVNRYLAEHYRLPRVVGDEFVRVSLPKYSLRGGLLGNASILTATSNGVETSPVTRGIWVLENILGTPPPPAPPDVEPLEPDIRGATTIRQQLAKHRNVATCAECHRKIDPIGFAMESFDPIGGLRRQYRNEQGKPFSIVDTSGTLPSGESFMDIAGLKRLLLEHKDQFARCLSEKMLTYALGRQVGFPDRTTVDTIVGDLCAKGGGLQDLVELIVTSKVFINE